MTTPKISVIIPVTETINQWSDALKSLLDQQYNDYEIIIVTSSAKFEHQQASSYPVDDRRIKYVLHHQGQGSLTLISAGIRESVGDFVTIMDADCQYHQERFQVHAAFLEQHPEIGLTLDGYKQTDATGMVQSVWYPPSIMTLGDLVQNQPLSLTSIVVRRECLAGFDLLEDFCSKYCDGTIIPYQLALDGCSFASMNRALRYHQFPKTLDSEYTIEDRVKATINALDRLFANHPLPNTEQFLTETAEARTYLEFSYLAFSSNQTAIGQTLLRKSIYLDRTILNLQAYKLLEFLIQRCIQDYMDHESRLRQIFSQLPQELAWINLYLTDAIARGYLNRGINAIMVKQTVQAKNYITTACEMGSRLNRPQINKLLMQLAKYEADNGSEATNDVLKDLVQYLQIVCTKANLRYLEETYILNRAFKNYHEQRYGKVPRDVLKATLSNPTYLTNRGILSILFHSFLHSRMVASS